MDALQGKLSSHHRLLHAQSWQHLTHLEHSIQEFDETTDSHFAPYRVEIEILRTILCVDVTAASAILAEIGADMLQFHSEHHLASRASLSPGNYESAGKNPHASSTAIPTQIHPCRVRMLYMSNVKNIFSFEVLKVSCPSRKEKALIATAHKMLTMI